MICIDCVNYNLQFKLLFLFTNLILESQSTYWEVLYSRFFHTEALLSVCPQFFIIGVNCFLFKLKQFFGFQCSFFYAAEAQLSPESSHSAVLDPASHAGQRVRRRQHSAETHCCQTIWKWTLMKQRKLLNDKKGTVIFRCKILSTKIIAGCCLIQRMYVLISILSSRNMYVNVQDENMISNMIF